jgi:hypothetical protein
MVEHLVLSLNLYKKTYWLFLIIINTIEVESLRRLESIDSISSEKHFHLKLSY